MRCSSIKKMAAYARYSPPEQTAGMAQRHVFVVKKSQHDATEGKTMIKLTGRLICRNTEETALVRRYLPEHIRLTKEEPGCLSFEVKETADPLIWSVEERFTSQQTFDMHQTRTKASAWGQKTVAIAREYAIVESV